MNKDKNAKLFKLKKIGIAVFTLYASVNSSFAADQGAKIDVNPSGANVQYGGGSSINGDTKVVVPIKNSNNNGQLANPVDAANQQGQTLNAPTTAPYGLPDDAQQQQQTQQVQQRNGQIDPVESTITILNTPKEKIRQLNRDLNDKGREIAHLPGNAPESKNTVLPVSLAPGAISPVVRVFKNKTTGLVITDMSGKPWPIENFDGLNTEDFSVKRLDKSASDGGSMLSITPNGAFVSGNLLLKLKGVPTLISIDFIPNSVEYDSKKELRIQAMGPDTEIASMGLPQSIDSALLSVLQGVTPRGSKQLEVSTNAAQAWIASDGSMYVRTRYKVMSPAYENVTSSPDGTYAYKMVATPVVLYKAGEGKYGEIKINGIQ